MKTNTTTTMFPYYSGNFALGLDPTAGSWNKDIFTAADGSQWTVDPQDDSHPAVDGTDVHYLIPAVR